MAYLRKNFFAKKPAICCFLDRVYIFNYTYPSGENINNSLEEIIKQIEQMKF